MIACGSPWRSVALCDDLEAFRAQFDAKEIGLSFLAGPVENVSLGHSQTADRIAKIG